MGSLPLSVLQTGLLISLVASCGSTQTASSSENPTPKPKPKPTPAVAVGQLETAIISTETGLTSIDANGIVKELSADPVSWCYADARSNVVWSLAVSDESGATLGVHGADGKYVVLASGFTAPDEIFVRYEEEKFDPYGQWSTALLVDLSKGPNLRGVIGCDGDAAWNCFVDGDLERPLPSLVADIKSLDGAKIENMARLTSIAERGRATGVEDRAEKEVMDLPQVAKTACTEEPEDCGKARRLGSSDYYLVVTANSRGDYYHEDKNMYFGPTEEFFDPATDTKSASAFKGSLQEADIFLSPSEQLLLYEGTLYSGRQGKIAGVEGEACGFMGGGRRYGTSVYDDDARP